MQLIFIHGSGGCKEIWKYQAEYFDNAITVNLPGHPHGNLCISIQEYSVWLDEFIQEQGFKDVVLVGHSMGGAIALQYALDHPQKLKGLVTIGSGAKLKVPVEVFALLEKALSNPEIVSQYINAAYTFIDPELRQMIQARDLENTPAALLNDFRACDGFDVLTRLSEISIPVLAIVGDKDLLTPPKYTRFLVNNIQSAQELVITRGTHFVFAEQPQIVNQGIEEFIQTL
ncbi:alpha/beta fold hydrolase [Paraglaciecola marina]|uniref:alpha/beta fold hydrolase n=1 Tax=Paraglaciecola marina TaxID=2500157 RepID=UPI00106006CE|nr:alpha/beta hydrolase [Paraglaciecola marina]